MDFISGQTLLEICKKDQISISTAMKQREIDHGVLTEEMITEKLNTVLTIMQNSATGPIKEPRRSIGGLLGGEAQKVNAFREAGQNVCGSTLSRAIAYSMAVLEVNATMGLIVAAPTAGSSGVLPGVLLALKETHNLDDETLRRGVLNASALGYILMRNASVSGAEAGCQAEVGAASAMAASAAVEMLGGTPEMCMQAASIALSNLLGLVCDPIAGLVESPCQSRNAIGVANALTCAELALAGVAQPIPFDEMAEAMYRVGKSLPFELRETAMGGCAGTPTGCTLSCQICGNCNH
ncbi:MAG TPA: L-serine ammonia-lyase, iron-sulfur-dependent, subunit alpha [Lachnospiraceae bacterium]|nr:L-serine ammonia-lyase, iron-sulfur-dependent, subunit alpha [Lachnospiraceae bacterium]